MISYERLLSFGDIIPLRIKCNVDKLQQELSTFKFSQYNTSKLDNPRSGLSITSIDGQLNGVDLESLYEVYALTGNEYNEMSFTTLTEVYYTSAETRKIVDPFRSYIGRSHFLQFKQGGYFPPHRDDRGTEEQHSLRIIVPIRDCNPPQFYFMFNDKVLNLNHGYAYFMNTNLTHSVFSYSNNSMLMVLNVKSCDATHRIILDSMLKV